MGRDWPVKPNILGIGQIVGTDNAGAWPRLLLVPRRVPCDSMSRGFAAYDKLWSRKVLATPLPIVRLAAAASHSAKNQKSNRAAGGIYGTIQVPPVPALADVGCRSRWSVSILAGISC